MFKCVGVLAGLLIAAGILSFIMDDLNIHISWFNAIAIEFGSASFGIIIGHIADRIR